ncbi:MAG: tyrosine-type recombinase/integrase [Eubacteriales bacterium]
MGQYKYETKKGTRWTAKFRYTDSASGERKVMYKRGFLTKRDAHEFENQFRFDLEDYDPAKADLDKKTFGDVYKEYMASFKLEDMKQNSLRTKETVFVHHIFPYFMDVPIRSITSESIHAWQQKIKGSKKDNGDPYSPDYLRTIQTQFNSIINYANSKGYLKANPLADIKNMGIKGKRIVYWSVEEYEQFAKYARSFPNLYCCYEILYWCGLREGEMLALTVDDVDFKNRTIRVNKTYTTIAKQEYITAPKTPSSNRLVSMPEFLCAELKEYISRTYDPQPGKRLFRISKSSLTKTFDDCAKRAGLNHIPIHGLRHSHVSLLISRKYDIFEISKRIGHKSIKTTQDIYGHLFMDSQKAMAEDLDRMRPAGNYPIPEEEGDDDGLE